MLPNFSWVIEGKLAAAGLPGAHLGSSLPADLEAMSSQGIRRIISLTEQPLASEALAQNDIEVVHLPIADMTAPRLESIEQFLVAVDETIGRGQAALVHCLAGLGRTGTMLACYLAREGRLTGDEAIEEIRYLRPGSIETPEQEATVRLFASHVASQQA